MIPFEFVWSRPGTSLGKRHVGGAFAVLIMMASAALRSAASGSASNIKHAMTEEGETQCCASNI